jgi:Flp pilus assembly protein TadB
MLTPLPCVIAVVYLVFNVTSPFGWGWAVLAVIGIALFPSNFSRYRHARRHERAGDADPADLRTLRRRLRS